MKKRGFGIALSYVNTFLNMVCGLLLSSFLLRILGDTEYGVYQTISSFANYLILLEFGTGTVMARNLSKCRAENASPLEIQKNISTILGITSILSSVIVIVAVGFYFAIDSIYAASLDALQIASAKNMFICIVGVLVLNFYAQTINGIALAHEEYTFSSKISIAKTVVRTAALVGLISWYPKSIIIVIVDVIVNVATVVYGMFFCKYKIKVSLNIKNMDAAILKASLPLCIALFLQTIVNQTNSTVGKFVIGVIMKPENVALYSVGLYVYSIFSSLTTIPVSIYLPQVTKDVVAGFEGKELTGRLIQPCRLIVMIGGMVLFGFVGVGRPFISIVYGEAYMQAWIIAIILMLPMFVNMSNAIVINVLDAKNKRLIRSVIMMVSTILNIFISIFMIRKFGVIGAAVATAVSLCIQIILLNIYYAKAIKIKVMYLFFNVYKGILIYQILAAAVAFALGRIISNVYAEFLICGAIYVLIAFGGVALFGKNEAEKRTIENIVKKITRKA